LVLGVATYDLKQMERLAKQSFGILTSRQARKLVIY